MILKLIYRQGMFWDRLALMGRQSPVNKGNVHCIFSEHVDFDLDERIWQMERLTYMKWDDGPTLDSTWSIKTDLNLINDYDFLRNNGSLYLHAFFFPTGKNDSFIACK